MAQQNGVNLQYTPVEEIDEIVNDLTKTFLSGKTRPLQFRIDQIKQVGFMVQDNEDEFFAALRHDLRRADGESYIDELNLIYADCKEMVSKLKKWAKPEKISTNMNYKLMGPKVYKEPKGVVLIIAPFNYPSSLALVPLMGALAGGNTVVLKPSEQTTATAALMTRLAAKYLDPSVVRVVNGAKDETVRLLENKWDHIFFTGSSAVGKIVATAAAKQLCSITLELGGKSPVVIFDDANLKVAAKRILWGKQVNAAQTCIAPDYILMPKRIQADFVKAYKEALKEFYPRGENPIDSNDFCSLISSGAYERLQKALSSSNGNILLGGDTDAVKKRIDQTLVSDVTMDDPLMQQEMFGPILPIVTCESKEDAARIINSNEHPLALYVFTSNKKNVEFIRENTRSGALVHGDTLIHFAVEGLPFGGTGNSGSGAYHGKKSFDTFVHERSFISVPNYLEPLLGLRYPPYTQKRLGLIKRFMGVKLNFSRPNQVGFLQSLLGKNATLKLLALVVTALSLLQRARTH